jgi:hypothetical protein
VVSAAVGLLSVDTVLDSGVLLKSHSGPLCFQTVRPARYSVSTTATSDGESFLVGVPDNAAAYRGGNYVQDGYGGMEALKPVCGMSVKTSKMWATWSAARLRRVRCCFGLCPRLSDPRLRSSRTC